LSPTPKRFNIRSALNSTHGIYLLFDSPFIKTQLRKQFMRLPAMRCLSEFITGEHSELPNATLHNFIAHQNGVNRWIKYMQILTNVTMLYCANFEEFLAILRHKACELHHCR